MNHHIRSLWVPVCSVVLACAVAALPATVKRERSEATLNTPASNVAGNGNISLYTLVNAGYRTPEKGGKGSAAIDPTVGGSIGVGGILQFGAQTTITGFRALGPTEAHLQITIPGNDRLRFIGGAVSGDMYLSSFQDTTSVGTDTAKPVYNPYLLATAIIDADWLAVLSWLPLKTYVALGLADDVGALDRYNQIAVRYAGEWKMKEHSIFVDGGVGFYKEKRNSMNTAGDRRYEQVSAWLEPGARYRFLERFSVLAGVRFPIFNRLKQDNGLRPLLVQISLKLEAPILFKETNTEAIRTLVFMEREKEQKKHVVMARTSMKKNSQEQQLLEGVDAELFGMEQADSTSSGLFQDEVNVQKEREDVQNKMDEIEKLLNETDLQ